MKIKYLILAKDKIQNSINEKIEKFAEIYNKCNPKSKIEEGDIESIDLNGCEQIDISTNRYYCGDNYWHNYLIPINLIDSCDECAIKNHIIKIKKEEEDKELLEKLDSENKKIELEKKQLKILQEKYKNI